MGTVFIISYSLKNLNIEEMTTSSEKYQLRFATALSQYTDVKILSACANSETRDKKGNLEFVGVSSKNINRSFFSFSREKQIYKALKHNADNENIIIFWGYSLHMVLALLYAKLTLKMSVVSFIFDSHRIAISHLNLVKRTVVDAYFQIGRWLTRFMDGYILFQEKAVLKLKAKENKCLILKPAVNESEAVTTIPSETFRVGFCGTFSHLNGIDALLETLPLLQKENIEINICGYGEFKERIQTAEQRYPFLKYHGVLDDQDLKSFYQNCDLLLNLRRIDDEAINFAFPSKLFEYASTGIPIVTTPLLQEKMFLENVYLLDSIDKYKIAEQILEAYHNQTIARTKGAELKKYVEQNHSFRSTAEKVFAFIKK